MTLAQIDLSRLAPPDAVSPIDYEAILDEIKQDAIALLPGLAPELQLESTISSKMLEIWAAREMMLLARVNDSVRAVLLATATGADLENLAALLGVQRQVIVAADPEAVPPVAAVYEDDAALRRRAQMAPEGLTNAGTAGSYAFHALAADPLVRDVGVISPAPGTVRVTVLSHADDGTPSTGLLAAVAARIETVRPLCDTPIVAAPVFTEFSVVAELQVSTAPGAGVAVAAAEAAVAAYLEDAFRVGRPVRRAALIAQLMQPGVDNVTLTQPAADLDPGPTGVARATSTTISAEVAP